MVGIGSKFTVIDQSRTSMHIRNKYLHAAGYNHQNINYHELMSSADSYGELELESAILNELAIIEHRNTSLLPDYGLKQPIVILWIYDTCTVKSHIISTNASHY